MQRLTNYIDGRHAAPASGRYLDNIDPATSATISLVPDSDRADVEAAVHAAAGAFSSWSGTPAADRARVLLRIADLIDENLDLLASHESADSGKPVSLAREIDIPRSALNFRFFAHACTQASSEFHESLLPDGGRAINYTLRSPRGVAGLISPWNLPLYLLTWKVAPALAAGCTAVAKPSELTPTTATILPGLCERAGLPPGVLNIVHGSGTGAGAPIVFHPQVPTISFTGSTAVGSWIAQHGGAMLKRMSLELGGKNPFIIFADADVEAAVDAAARAAFTNSGQICLCGSRLLVERGIADRVIQGVVERARRLVIGDPADPATQFGPLSSSAHRAKVARYVGAARELGGTVHCGGTSPPVESLSERVRAGAYFEPTVISGLDPGCAVEQEEIFGPVVTVQTFDSEEHAAALANGTPYGLAATLWTQDVSRAHRFSASLRAGVVWVNCWMLRDLRTPFGGMKQSGLGREGGWEAMRFFTEPRNVCVRV